jgi:predicted MFS family arabinose efflux permease
LSVDRVKIAEAFSEPTPAPALRKPPPPPDVSSGAILTLAAACGLLVANIYYAQPLIAEIAQSLGLATGAAGLIVTMSQIGYGVGLCSSCRSATSSRTASSS